MDDSGRARPGREFFMADEKTSNSAVSADHRFSQVIESTVEKLLPLYTETSADRPDAVLSSVPNSDQVVLGLKYIIGAFFPGRTSAETVRKGELNMYLQTRLNEAFLILRPEIERALPYRWSGEAAIQGQVQSLGGNRVPPDRIEEESNRVLEVFFGRLPDLRKLLITDVQAAYDGDPAALSFAEVKVAYPGLLAIASHRIAHELYKLDIPIVPRIMSEWTHRRTGIDIHPGARIGSAFFIDHGTGVVIGETTRIGNRVKLYQGVSLGAKSFPVDANGIPIKHVQRHPTVEDGVVIYANATILGGDTVIGENAVIGGNVFVTQSVPAGSVVSYKN